MLLRLRLTSPLFLPWWQENNISGTWHYEKSSLIITFPFHVLCFSTWKQVFLVFLIAMKATPSCSDLPCKYVPSNCLKFLHFEKINIKFINWCQKYIILNFSAIWTIVQSSHVAGTQSKVNAIRPLWKMWGTSFCKVSTEFLVNF